MSSSRLLYPGGASPPLDGKTPVFEEVGADPSAGVGCDRPPGSLVKHGPDYYWKTDTGATDWVPTPFNTGGVVGVDGLVADWTIGSPRWYALDADGGSDANAGFSDVSGAAALAAAVATPAKLKELVPPHGAGRTVIVLVKRRAAGAAYATGLDLSFLGYAYSQLRGTEDGTESATDLVKCGAVDATGTAVWTVTAGVDAYEWTVTEALPAANSLRGRRVRWLTGALAGQCARIYSHTAGAGGTLVTDSPFTGTPVAGATFAIEQVGASFPTVIVQYAGTTGLRGLAIANQLVGIKSTTAGFTNFTVTGPASVNVCFCEANGANFQTINRLVLQPGYVRQTAASASPGPGLYSSQGTRFTSILDLDLSSSDFTHTTGPTFENIVRANIGDRGSDFNRAPMVVNVGLAASVGGAPNANAAQNIFGTLKSATTKLTTIRGSGNDTVSAFHQSRVAMRGVIVTDLGANPLRFTGNGCSYSVDEVSGSSGNTDVGLDFTGCRDGSIVLGSQVANTITGNAGDIRVAGPAICEHSDFTKTNLPDVNGNNVQGSAGTLVRSSALFPGGNHAGVALEPGLSVYQDGTGAALSDADAAASTRSDGIVLNTAAAADGSPVYIAPPGSFPYVFPETVVTGGLAYVSVTAGRIQGNPPAAGDFKLRLGYFLVGVDNTSGRLSYHPELLAASADGEA